MPTTVVSVVWLATGATGVSATKLALLADDSAVLLVASWEPQAAKRTMAEQANQCLRAAEIYAVVARVGDSRLVFIFDLLTS